MESPESWTFRSATPAGELVLRIRAGAAPSAALILEGMFLMDSGSAESERALAREGCAALRRVRGKIPGGARVLVGGLGLGITLRELLAQSGVARAEVVEIFEALVGWNRGPLVSLNGGALADPRVECRVGDLRSVLADAAAGPFDLLLLDVDNGPTWLALPSNRWLYSRAGREAMRARMALPGVAAFWATERAPEFEAELADLAWGEWSWASVTTPVRLGEPPLVCAIYLLVVRE
jgi:spermidine synthase